MAPQMMRAEYSRIEPGINAGLGGKSGAAPGRGITWLFDRLAAWGERRRQRRALLRLDDSMLRDIGLSRADVERESAKPYWMI